MLCDNPPKDLIVVVDLNGTIYGLTSGGDSLWRFDSQKAFGPTLSLIRSTRRNPAADPHVRVPEASNLPDPIDHIEIFTADGIGRASCAQDSDFFVEPTGEGTIYLDINGSLRKFERSISSLSSGRVLYQGGTVFLGRKDSDIIYLNPCNGVLVKHLGTSACTAATDEVSSQQPLIAIGIDSHKLIIDRMDDALKPTFELSYLNFYTIDYFTPKTDEGDIIPYKEDRLSGPSSGELYSLHYTYSDGILKVIHGNPGSEFLSFELRYPPVALFHFSLDTRNPSYVYNQREMGVISDKGAGFAGAFVPASRINGACYVLPNLELSRQSLVNSLAGFLCYPTPVDDIASTSLGRLYQNSSYPMYSVDTADSMSGLSKAISEVQDEERNIYARGKENYKLMVYIEDDGIVGNVPVMGLYGRSTLEVGGADYRTPFFFIYFALTSYVILLFILRKRLLWNIPNPLISLVVLVGRVVHMSVPQNARQKFLKMMFKYLESQDNSPPQKVKVVDNVEPAHSAPKPSQPDVTYFELKEVLGTGSNGTVVFRALFRDKEIAVKRVLSDFYRVARKEIKVLGMSDFHKNIIRYYSYEHSGSFIYIGLELCYGSLYDLIELSDLNEHMCLAKKFLNKKLIMNQIASGMAHIHALNIVHSDVKPHNILIAPDNQNRHNHMGFRAVLSDFGLSKVISSKNTLPSSLGNTQVRGTVGWRAPEVVMRCNVNQYDSTGYNSSDAEGKWNISGTSPQNCVPPRWSLSSDIFSLGCCFYYIISNGEHPHGPPGDRESNLLKKKKPRLESNKIGSLGADMVSKMLSYNPRTRPSSSGVLMHPFFWDKFTKLTFLADVSDVSKFNLTSHNKNFIIELEADRNIFNSNWGSKIPPVVMQNFGRISSYRTHSIISLLRFIRNLKNHMWSLNDEEKQIIGCRGDQIMDFFDSAFPSLFIHVYRVTSKYSDGLGEYFKAKYFAHLS